MEIGNGAGQRRAGQGSRAGEALCAVCNTNMYFKLLSHGTAKRRGGCNKYEQLVREGAEVAARREEVE